MANKVFEERKRNPRGLGVVALISVFLAMSTVGYVSCSSPEGSHRNKLDTISKALFRVQYPNKDWSGPIMDTVLIQYISKYVFKDSVQNKGGHWVTDTFTYGRIIDDTSRDVLKKPILDSTKRPVWHYIYFAIPRGYWQKVTIPTR